MESEKVLSLPVEARWLFVIIILSADDVGLFEATEFKLARRADVNRDLAGKLLLMLADADLVRFYEVDGKRFGFIPRFRQRIQLKRMKHPAPPVLLVTDDADAVSKINGLAPRPTDAQPLDDGCAPDGQPSEAEAEAKADKRISPLPSAKTRRRRAPSDLPACQYADVVKVFHDVLPEMPRIRLLDGRKPAIQSVWKWALTSRKGDGSARATTAAEALAWFRTYFERVRGNDFLMGRVEPGGKHSSWRCDLDYLLTQRGMRQVIEKTELAA